MGLELLLVGAPTLGPRSWLWPDMTWVDLPLLCTLPSGSRHVVSTGPHRRGDAAVLQLNTVGTKVGTLTHHPWSMVHTATVPWAQATTVSCIQMLCCWCISPSSPSLPSHVQAPGTKTLVPQEICTWLHLSHQHHCSRNCTCTLGPRCCSSSLCLTPGFTVTLTACVPGLVPRRIPSVRTSPMDHKKRRGPQQPSLLRTPVALVSTATYRTSLVLATEDTGRFCWDCPQLTELHGDYVAVPSQEPEMLHCTPPSWSPQRHLKVKVFLLWS